MNETVKITYGWEMAANQEQIKLKASLTTKQTMYAMNIAIS